MPTANAFVPLVGSFDAPFAIVSGDGTTIPRDTAANTQGDPRPGVLRWVLLLITPDATQDGDDEFNITVPIPEDFDLDANILVTGANSVFPSLSLTAGSAGVAGFFVAGAQTTVVDVPNRTVTVAVTVDNVAQVGGWILEIDFCHSAVN
ncbi:MAG: hypothetical protein ACE10O_00935 [Candidatus Acidiferrales bacterium]